MLLDDLESFAVSLVLKDGQVPVYPEGVPVGLRDTMRSVPVAFGIPGSPERVRVIDIQPGQLITGAGSAAPQLADGHVVADPSRDLAKIAVIERHHATGRVGLGLVRGFGLRAGAFCSTVAHDAHNLVVVGASDADMALCAARAQELGGGLVVARDGVVRGELALPIAGLLSDRPLEEVAEGLEGLQDLLAEQGVEIDAPFMTLSFLALSVIPSLKITDRGLVDVDAFELVALELWSSARAFVARFGALYEHSPWVAERAWRPGGFDGIEELDAALRAAMYAASRDEQLALIRAHPDLGEKVAPLTDHSRAEQADARALRRGLRALRRHQRRVPVEVRDPVRDLRARAHEGLDPGQRRCPSGQLGRAGDRDRAGRDRKDCAAAAGGCAVSLSTHVLDTVRGRPAAGVTIVLRRGGESSPRR